MLAPCTPGARVVDEPQRDEHDGEEGERDEVVADREHAVVLDGQLACRRGRAGRRAGSRSRPPVTLPAPNRNWSPFVVSVWKSWRKKSVTIAR